MPREPNIQSKYYSETPNRIPVQNFDEPQLSVIASPYLNGPNRNIKFKSIIAIEFKEELNSCLGVEGIIHTEPAKISLSHKGLSANMLFMVLPVGQYAIQERAVQIISERSFRNIDTEISNLDFETKSNVEFLESLQGTEVTAGMPILLYQVNSQKFLAFENDSYDDDLDYKILKK